MNPTASNGEEMVVGLFAPVYCPRNREDCESLDFIIAEGHKSFVCCGENAKRALPQDKYRVCFKNVAIDDMQDYDKRDITHAAKVLLGALAIIEERDSGAYHQPPEDTP